ncbi:AraC family transcriptional regulator [Mesonia sp. K7]|uniref:helix-turn-helix domain-containing protein n=1 Tax=Mesonia sp. K7 TaxID=2218606 RepID=UPI000DA80BC0|nr:AraC family transcriptional regulator [Mesonia sp. K7]PZD78269.1 AraC family transcriptional regulator [Mesonia sp. K7]
MPTPQIQVKNMVCPRCVMSVEHILQKLDIGFHKVELGWVKLKKELTNKQKSKLQPELEKVGFLLIENPKESLVNQIKSIIVKQFESENPSFGTFDELLKDLSYNYTYLSHLFSEVEGESIQQYYQRVRIEKAKELLQNQHKNISEIAYHLGYSSNANFSTSFKKLTGFTPTQFKNNFTNERHFLGSETQKIKTN